jgi:uncharacterized protein (DUF697 family)
MYRTVLHQAGLIGPLERSVIYGVVTASITVIGGFIAARLLTARGETVGLRLEASGCHLFDGAGG